MARRSIYCGILHGDNGEAGVDSVTVNEASAVPEFRSGKETSLIFIVGTGPVTTMAA